MKKSLLYFALACVFFSFSACTKEQMSLNMLYGTWRLTSELGDDGTLVTFPSYYTREILVTFYLCNDKDLEDCQGTQKTTGVNSTPVPPITTIAATTFNYSVFGKSQLVWGSTVYEIEKISKKELVIHDVEHPLATKTYEKE